MVLTYSIRMRTRFRGLDVREGMLLDGPAGWAEFSPFWDYDHVASVSWLRAAMESAYEPWPEPVRTEIPVNCTVPAVDPAAAVGIVQNSAGCRTAKVKVAQRGQGFSEDVARVEAVRDAIGPAGRVRVDANGGWTVDEAVSRIGTLSRFELEYVEQPCATTEELARVRRRVDTPIAADESIRGAADPMAVKALGAADIAVLKVQPIGGVHACLRIAEQIDMPVVVSSALETSIGIAAGVALAAALPDLPYASGLATVQLLQTDVVRRPLLPVDGVLQVTRPTVDPDRFASAAANESARKRWRDRLDAVQALMPVRR